MDNPDNLNDEKPEKPNSPVNNASVYDGVLLHSGEYVTGHTDVSIPGRGFDFVFTRTHRSQAIYSGVLGWGWDHIYNQRLQELPAGDILYFDGTGRRERYEKEPLTLKYKSPAGLFNELQKTQDGMFTILNPDRSFISA